MLGARRGLAVLASTAGLVLGACSLGGQAATPASTTTSTTTTTTVPDRPDTIRIGLAVNGDAPTAEFDAQIEAILEEAAISTAAETGISIDLRPVSITTPGQAEGAMLSLINDGVNVVITGCDDATVPAVVEAATANELLAVTGCVSLPRPDIDRLSSEINSDLFIDLSALRDNARAIANHADAEGFSSLAVVGSTLVPDVERVCVDLQDELAPEVNVEGEPEATGDVVDVEGEQLLDEDEDEDEVGDGVVDDQSVSIIAKVNFVELVDAPGNVVSDLVAATEVDPPDAIVVCALPPTVGDIVSELRNRGFDQPVILPWYGDGQTWADGTRDVFIVTPASRYGDDPAELTTSLFEALTIDGEQPDAVDIVTADTLSVLSDAAARSGSVGSQRVATAIRNGDPTTPISGISGSLHVGGDDLTPVQRVYRVVAIEEGRASFLREVNSLDEDGVAEDDR